MAGKYDKLFEYLEKNYKEIFTISYKKIEKIVGFKLPKSYYNKSYLNSFGCPLRRFMMKHHMKVEIAANKMVFKVREDYISKDWMKK